MLFYFLIYYSFCCLDVVAFSWLINQIITQVKGFVVVVVMMLVAVIVVVTWMYVRLRECFLNNLHGHDVSKRTHLREQHKAYKVTDLACSLC